MTSPPSSTASTVSSTRSPARAAKQNVIADLPVWLEFAKQVVLIGLGVLFYFGVRGMTEGSVETALDNGWRILEFEARIYLDIETDLQGWIRESDTLTTLVNWIYIWLHWPLIATTLIWLHHSHRLQYLEARNAMFLSGAIGLIIFVSFPVAPPRLLDPRFVDTVTELSSSYRVFQPPGLVNKYAAVPSLHVGWNLLMGIAIYRSSTRLLPRMIAVVSPALMAFAVIATANHYTVDGIIGAVVALSGLALALAITKPIARYDPLTSKSLSSSNDEPHVIDDDPGQSSAGQLNGIVNRGHSPHEYVATATQPVMDRRREQAAVDDRTIDLRDKPEQQDEFEAVAGRADRAGIGPSKRPQ